MPAPEGDARAHAGEDGPPERALLWREVRLLTVLAVVAAGAAVFVLATGVFLLVFGGVLLAILLHAGSSGLAAHTPLPQKVALAVIAIVALGALVGMGWLAAPHVASQATQFAERVPQALDAVDDWVTDRIGATPRYGVRDALPAAQSFIGTLPNIVTTTFGALGSIVVLVAVGLYLAAHPKAYRDGFVRLFALKRRDRVGAVLDEIADVLRRWLVGQLVAMLFVGILSYVGLTLLGVPLALGLAVLTGLLEFVPYIGPIAAAVPVVLVSSTEGWQLAVGAIAVYTAIQVVEGYVLVPLIQQRAIYLPAGVILVVQVLLGVLLGVVGIVLATPIAAAVTVFVRRCYVEAVLEGPHEPVRESGRSIERAGRPIAQHDEVAS